MCKCLQAKLNKCTYLSWMYIMYGYTFQIIKTHPFHDWRGVRAKSLFINNEWLINWGSCIFPLSDNLASGLALHDLSVKKLYYSPENSIFSPLLIASCRNRRFSFLLSSVAPSTLFQGGQKQRWSQRMEHLAGGFAINLAELSVKQADFVCIRSHIHNPHKLWIYDLKINKY